MSIQDNIEIGQAQNQALQYLISRKGAFFSDFETKYKKAVRMFYNSNKEIREELLKKSHLPLSILTSLQIYIQVQATSQMYLLSQR